MTKATAKVRPLPLKQPVATSPPALSRQIAFWGLAALLFFPPYFRGLFFAPEQERALIFAALVFWITWLWKWSRQDYQFLGHPLEYFMLALPAVYAGAALVAVNHGLAVDEVVENVLYFLTFWAVARLVTTEGEANTLLTVVYLSATGVALAGLATATGVIHIKDGFVGGRIYSSFQYPNALASFLTAAFFLGVYLWRRSVFLAAAPRRAVENRVVPVTPRRAREKPPAGRAGKAPLKGIPRANWPGSGKAARPAAAGPGRLAVWAAGVSSRLSRAGVEAWLARFQAYLFTMGNLILLAVFLGARSRGGLVALAFILPVYLALLPRGHRGPILCHLVAVGGPAVLVISRFLAAVEAGNMNLAWAWVLAGLALAVVLQYGLERGEKFLAGRPVAGRWLVPAVLAVVLVAAAGAAVYGGWPQKLASFLNPRNLVERLYFYGDALKMIRLRPVLGWGGGGWQEAYRAFQGYLYNSTQIHSYYLQVAVEAGIIGLAVVAGIWGSFLVAVRGLFVRVKEDPRRRLLVATLAGAAVVVGLHAAIDFDLSLAALTLVLVALFGLTVALGRVWSPAPGKARRSYQRPSTTVLVAATLAAAAVAALGASLAAAGAWARDAGRYAQQGNYGAAVERLQKAVAWNPFSADYHTQLARLYQLQGKYDLALAEARAAALRSRYSASRQADLASVAYAAGRPGEAVGYAEAAVNLAPFQVYWYELLGRTAFLAGLSSLTGESDRPGGLEEARGYFEVAAGVPDRIQARMATLGPRERGLWTVAPLMAPTPAVNLNTGAARYFLKDWSAAEADLKKTAEAQDADQTTRGEAYLWLAVLKERQGQTSAARDFLNRARELVPQYATGYETLKALPTMK
jgi:tetratricopeptide (TPR) repeat protein